MRTGLLVVALATFDLAPLATVGAADYDFSFQGYYGGAWSGRFTFPAHEMVMRVASCTGPGLFPEEWSTPYSSVDVEPNALGTMWTFEDPGAGFRIQEQFDHGGELLLVTGTIPPHVPVVGHPDGPDLC